MAKQNRLETLLERQEARKTLQAQKAPPLFLELYKQMVIEGMSEVCRCNRAYMVNATPHCPNCGSTNAYSFTSASSIRMLPNQQQCQSRGFRCRRCTLPFTDVDTFLHCEAQEPQETMKEVRQREKATSALQAAGFANKNDFIERLEAFRASQNAKKDGDEK